MAEIISRLAGYAKMARPVLSALNKLVSDEVQEEIKAYLDNGVVVQSLPKVGKSASPVKIRTVVITGTLSKPRSHFSQLLTASGFTVASSLSRRVDYLVVGSSPTAHKVEKARRLDIHIIDEEYLLRRVLGVKND